MTTLRSNKENETYEVEKLRKATYYKEAKKYILENNSEFCSSIDLLFSTCAEYYLRYLMYCKIKKSITILQNYMPSNNQLTNRPSKFKQSHHQDIITNLYAEFFAQLYDDYYSQLYDWNTVYSDRNLVEGILTEHLGIDNKKNIEYIADAVYEKDKKIDLSKFHSAMCDVKEAFSLSKPAEEESVITVLTTEALLELYIYIQNDNIAGAFIYSSALRIFLTTTENEGNKKNHKYQKYVGNYFDLKCQHNLPQLNRYFFGETKDRYEEVRGLLSLLTEYEDTVDLLDSFS